MPDIPQGSRTNLRGHDLMQRSGLDSAGITLEENSIDRSV